MKSDSSRALTWPKVQLGSVCESIRNGLSIKQGEIPGGIPITRIETISTGEIDPTRVGHAGVADGTLDQWVLRPGDILFSHINSLPHIGKCALYSGFPAPLIHGMNLLALRPALELVEPAFLLRFLRSPECRAQYLRFVNPSVNQVSLSIGKLRLTEIPLPPLAEQRRIAAILDKAADVRRKRQQTLDLADQFLRSAVLDMFGDPVTNPKGWTKVALGSLCTIRRGASPRPIQEYLGGTVPWIKIGDADPEDDLYIRTTAERVTEAGAAKSVRLRPGSLVFANSGSLGFARILGIEGCIHDGWLSLEDLDPSIDLVFLLKQLNATTPHFLRIAPEGTQKNLNTSLMKAHAVILPPRDLQIRFSALVGRAQHLRGAGRTAADGVSRLSHALTQSAFSEARDSG